MQSLFEYSCVFVFVCGREMEELTCETPFTGLDSSYAAGTIADTNNNNSKDTYRQHPSQVVPVVSIEHVRGRQPMQSY